MSCGDLEWMIHIILNRPFYRWQLKVTEKLGQCQTVSNWKPFLINVRCWLVLVDEIRTTVEWVLLHRMSWFHFNFVLTPPLTAEKGIQKQGSCEWYRIKRKLNKNVSVAQETVHIYAYLCIFKHVHIYATFTSANLLQKYFRIDHLGLFCGFDSEVGEKSLPGKGKWQI